MRLTSRAPAVALAILSSSVFFGIPAQGGPGADVTSTGPTVAPESPRPKDLLGDMVVVAAATRSLPKIGVVPSLSADMSDVTLRSVVRRDLDLCGEFDLLSDDAAPDGLFLDDSPVDTKAWGKKGAEAVIRVTAHPVEGSPDKVELIGQAFLVKSGETPVFEKKATAQASSVRVASHRMADALIGALTGQNGGFASRLTFASGDGKLRRAYVIDADGSNAKGVSAEGDTVVGPAFGKGEELYWASSRKNAPFRVQSETGKDIGLGVQGSVYGLAFSKDRSKVAVSVGQGSAIRLFLGADFDHLAQASTAPFAMEPAFTPTGKLAFVGLGATGQSQRVFVDDKPVTPDGVFAMSPTFCNHPDGVKLVFAAGALADTDLFVTGEQGGSLTRLTQDQGKNASPACSPDGRMIAFFTTRKTGDGPGLYVMRTDGLRPRRISPLLGDSLRWDPLPP